VSEPLWYRDAVIYQLRIASFYDSDGDGIGDLRGLTAKLDYLQDLGVTALWLLPFYPSPLRDDGYDIAHYTEVHPSYGTLRDFRALLREAHRRGLRVITELVINHTSDQHPWFQRARRAAPGSRAREFYVWSDHAERYKEARIIFKDFEASNWAWDPVANAYYWHRFYAHQPDLNFDNPEVRKAVLRALDFWLGMGVDGLRLDAIPYLFEREGTSCENLPETHGFLRELRAHVDARYEGRMLLAEANQWPEDAVAYFGEGNECHMAFHFPVMPRLFMGLQMEDRYPIVDILEQTPAIPEACQWAMFLRNHDELTLEMVTDEERDYMWRTYARDPRARINLGIRRRLAPLLGGSRRKIELMTALLLSLPGTPILYYGDELGMGDNIFLGDRNGVRTPMQWSPDRNAGFSRANAQRLFLPVVVDPEYHYEAVNVETQAANSSSLLWWTKRILALRKQHPAFGRGRFEPLLPQNPRVFAFLRIDEDDVMLVVANLSRFSQYVELDLSRFEGHTVVELMGNVAFPPVGHVPYLLTLSPHTFHWFALRPPAVEASAGRVPPTLHARGRWDRILAGSARDALARALGPFLIEQRWFRAKARQVRSTRITDAVPLEPADAWLVFLEVAYTDGEPESYVLPIAFEVEADPAFTIAELVVEGDGSESRGALVEASHRAGVAAALLDLVRGGRQLRAGNATLRGRAMPGARGRLRAAAGLEARLLGAEQSNSSWVIGDQLVAKLLRKLDDGESVELEVTRRLTERGRFAHTPPLVGWVEFERGGQRSTLLVVHGFVVSSGDAWSWATGALDLHYDEVLAQPTQDAAGSPGGGEGGLSEGSAAPFALEMVELLGRRVAQMHAALVDPDTPEFAPERSTPFSQRSFYQSLRNRMAQAFSALEQRAGRLEAALREEGETLLDRRAALDERLRELLGDGGMRIRCHGDLHLGQVLFTGRDFVVIDFEGEPARSLAERRRRRSPLYDVAGMLRSFDYAAELTLTEATEGSPHSAEQVERLAPWARRWVAEVSRAFLAGYFDEAGAAEWLPRSEAARARGLALHQLEKALYELGYELNNRPELVGVPLRAILRLLEEAGDRG
jgi:maltose alpha-D-glucosyltransferase/alpha-amylase